ncbi:MAG: hypothetical protein IT477_10825 [Rhodanobacteraceae bacterium]|nr:hypothetical protein [Rhodanobacteraceae bacterium]
MMPLWTVDDDESGVMEATLQMPQWIFGTPLSTAPDITSRVLMDRIASEMERMIGAALP